MASRIPEMLHASFSLDINDFEQNGVPGIELRIFPMGDVHGSVEMMSFLFIMVQEI
jgi:hypothetical protein